MLIKLKYVKLKNMLKEFVSRHLNLYWSLDLYRTRYLMSKCIIGIDFYFAAILSTNTNNLLNYLDNKN